MTSKSHISRLILNAYCINIQSKILKIKSNIYISDNFIEYIIFLMSYPILNYGLKCVNIICTIIIMYLHNFVSCLFYLKIQNYLKFYLKTLSKWSDI